MTFDEQLATVRREWELKKRQVAAALERDAQLEAARSKREATKIDVTALVERLMSAFKLDDRPAQEDVSAVWRDLVGERLAAASNPSGIKDGVLIVECTNPAILFFLRTEVERRVLPTLAKKFGVQKVRFR